MKYADLQNRWAYKGSLTTPPCTKTVYFNVLRKVWPLKKKHLEQFRTLMRGHGNNAFFKTDGKPADGNHRVVQPVNTQDPVIIVNSINAGNQKALFLAFLILFIIATIAFGAACYMWIQGRKVGNTVPADSVEMAEEKSNAK